MWNLQSHTFTFHVSLDEKPFSRRGIHSIVNSLHDPLGFVAPIMIQGKALVSKLSTDQCELNSSILRS